MGKSPLKKRTSLQKQYARSFVLALILSIMTSLLAIFMIHIVFHYFSGFHSLELRNQEMAQILNYASKNPEAILQGDEAELTRLAERANASFLIKDLGNPLEVASNQDSTPTDGEPYLFDLVQELRSGTTQHNSLIIPLIDPENPENRKVLVITQSVKDNATIILILEILIPIVAFTFFILLFARKYGKRIQRPLGELMMAVGKIQSRDLDFNIAIQQEDEIGDLAAAFEAMRENLRSSLVREWKLEQDRREMVAALTHDLRTPLAIIQGHVEGLQDGLKSNPDKLDSYLSIVLENAKRAKLLIDEMNEVSEIDSPGFALDRADTDLAAFLAHKRDEFSLLCASKGIDLQYALENAHQVSHLYKIDINRLSQVLDNVISNSIRYTPEGGVLSFTVRMEADAAFFKICDSGPGFSETDLNNLFKKFYKGDLSRSAEKGHSGLGLYIARSIISLHGGDIKVFNNPSGGACLAFNIARC